MLADSKFDDAAAAKVLDSALDADPSAPDVIRVRALILRAEVAHRLGDADRARAWLGEARAIDLGDADRSAIADDLRRAEDMEAALGSGSSD